jgi:hypothetical protein
MRPVSFPTHAASELAPTTTTTAAAVVACCCLLRAPNRDRDLDVRGFSASVTDLRLCRSAARTGSRPRTGPRPRLLENVSATGDRFGDEFMSGVERLGDEILTVRSRDGDRFL